MFTSLRYAIILLMLAPVNSMSQENVPTYDGSIKSILIKRCGKCHGGDQPRGEFEVGTFDGIMHGGISGPAIVPGNSADSLLFTLTAQIEEPSMPPNSPKIPASEIELIRTWIDRGAVEKAGSNMTTSRQGAADTGRERQTPTGLKPFQPMTAATAVTAVAVSTELGLIALPAVKSIHLYDLANGKPKGQIEFPEGEVHSLAFHANGQRLIAAGGVGADSGAAVLFDTKDWKRLAEVRDDSEAIITADLSSDGKLMVVGGPLKTVKVYTLPDAKLIHTLRKPTDWVLSTSFSPDSLLLAAGDRFGGLFVWESRSGKEFLTLRGHTKGITSLAWDASGDRLASASEDGTIRVWDLHSGKESHKWLAHQQGVTGLGVTSTGDFVSTGRDRMIRIWNASAEKIAEFGPINDIPTKLATSPSHIVVGDWSGKVYLLKSGKNTLDNLQIPLNSSNAFAIGTIEIPLPELADSRAALSAETSKLSDSKLNSNSVVIPTPRQVTQPDIERKRLTLRALEETAERLKQEASMDPTNSLLIKAYLQVCESIVSIKADLIQTEQVLTKRNADSP